jgi:hypothetical protein
MKTRIVLAATVCVLGFFASAASARLVNIDIDGRSSNGESIPGAMTGAAGVGAAGDQWNSYLVDCVVGHNPTPYDPGVSAHLADSAGVLTATRLDLSTSAGDTTAGSVRSGNGLLDDYVYLGPNVVSQIAFTLSGLIAGNSYDLYLYGVGGAQPASTYPGKFSVGGVDKTLTSTTAFDGTFVENREYVAFSGVIADASGTISGQVSSSSNPAFYSVFNGIQVSGEFASIPEPATSTLVASGLFGLIAYAWRKRT